MGAVRLQNLKTLPRKCAVASACQVKAGETPVKSAPSKDRRGIAISALTRDINVGQMNIQKILMNASIVLVLMASALTQTALSAVNVPWDTALTLVESDVKTLMSATLEIPVETAHAQMLLVDLSVRAMTALSLGQ